MNFKFMKQKSEKKRYYIVGKHLYTLKLITNSKNFSKHIHICNQQNKLPNNVVDINVVTWMLLKKGSSE